MMNNRKTRKNYIAIMCKSTDVVKQAKNATKFGGLKKKTYNKFILFLNTAIAIRSQQFI